MHTTKTVTPIIKQLRKTAIEICSKLTKRLVKRNIFNLLIWYIENEYENEKMFNVQWKTDRKSV